MNTGWVQKRERLNRKVVIRINESLYQNLLTFLENNPKFTTISQLIRFLLYDQLSQQNPTGLKTKGGIEYGRTKTKTTNQGQ
jgi:hypothetical protein